MAPAMLIHALEMFHKEQNIILLNVEWEYWKGNFKTRTAGSRNQEWRENICISSTSTSLLAKEVMIFMQNCQQGIVGHLVWFSEFYWYPTVPCDTLLSWAYSLLKIKLEGIQHKNVHLKSQSFKCTKYNYYSITFTQRCQKQLYFPFQITLDNSRWNWPTLAYINLYCY